MLLGWPCTSERLLIPWRVLFCWVEMTFVDILAQNVNVSHLSEQWFSVTLPGFRTLSWEKMYQKWKLTCEEFLMKVLMCLQKAWGFSVPLITFPQRNWMDGNITELGILFCILPLAEVGGGPSLKCCFLFYKTRNWVHLLTFPLGLLKIAMVVTGFCLWEDTYMRRSEANNY